MNTLLRSIAIIILCMQPITGLFCADQSAQKAHARIQKLLQHINPDATFLQEKESDPANLRGHRWKRQEGKSRSEEDYKGNPSQSAQYRTLIPDEKIKQALGIDLSSHPDLLEKIQEEERRHPDKFAFYHGSKLDFLPVLDLLQLLYKLTHNITEDLDWFPLRTMKDYFFEDVALEDYLKKNGVNIHDHQAPYRNHLLSTNLSIPGHLSTGESSLYYFLNSYSNINPAMIGDIFTTFIRDSFPSKEISPIVSKFINLQFNRLRGKLKGASNNGILLQILIDKKIVDETAYLCFGFGKPHTTRFMDAGWDKNLRCYTHIRPTLEALQKTPKQLNEAKQINQLQARILLREKYFAQPNRHVIIKRYHTIPDDVLETYNKEILSLAYLLFKHFATDRNMSILPAATNAVARGIHDTDWTVRSTSLKLFSKLFEMNYKPAFKAATNTATTGILDTNSDVRYSALNLFAQLFKAKHKPALQAASHAASKGLEDTDDGVRIFAHKLKALIDKQQGTEPQARSTIDYLRQRFTQAVAFIRSRL